ncbi:MAG: M15 family metallopeptidase [Roseburia sp.]|nr:M15 family metallopeptidase [Roseburia sp.]
MRSIPNIANPERYELRGFINTKFVEVKTNEYFNVQMQYVRLGMKNAESQCLVRETVYDMLLKAAKRLPSGYRFRIYDAWRSYKLQQEIYDVYSDKLISEHHLELASKAEQESLIRKYVSVPNYNTAFPPVHTTGGAVDLTIEDSFGEELDMGTDFDEFSDKTRTDYFEKYRGDQVRDNRRLLHEVMTDTGFTNYPSEWWHYDYGDMFWAYYKNEPAKYSGMFSRYLLVL